MQVRNDLKFLRPKSSVSQMKFFLPHIASDQALCHDKEGRDLNG